MDQDVQSYRLAEIRMAKIRAVRTLRLILMTMREAFDDVALVSSLDPRHTQCEREALAKHYGELEPLLVAAGRAIKRYPENPCLAEVDMKCLGEKCEALLARESEAEFCGLKAALRAVEERCAASTPR
jgi:hypothetical protein